MPGYSKSISIIGVIAIVVFGFLLVMNQFGRSLFTGGQMTTDQSQQQVERNVLLSPLSTRGDDVQEIALIGDQQIQVILPDPQSPKQTIAVIDAVAPQYLTWAKDRLYWVEKRVVKKSSSSARENTFVLVEASFGEGVAGGQIQTQDVYRSDVSIESLSADPSGQFISFVESSPNQDRELFVYAVKTAQVRRIAQQPVSVAWSQATGRIALVVAQAQSPRPKTQYVELSSSGETKTTVDLPEAFGGFGLTFINDSTLAGVEWSDRGSAKLQTVDLQSNTVTDIGEVAKNSDARIQQSATPVYPELLTLPATSNETKGSAVLITVPNDVNSIYTIATREQTYLQIDEQPIGWISPTTVLVQRGFDLFSVNVKSGIQTLVASNVTAAALRSK